MNINTGFDIRQSNIAKGVLILIMLMHHTLTREMVESHGVKVLIPVSMEELANINGFLKLCVGGFVFITVYGLTLKIRDMSNRDVFCECLKRYTKVISAFWVVFLIIVLYYKLFLGDYSFYETFTEFGPFIKTYLFMDAMGLSYIFRTPTINVTWWFISVELIIIFITPVVYRFYKKFGMISIPVSLFFPLVAFVNDAYIASLLLTMTLGVFAADQDILSRIKKFGEGKISVKIIKAVCVFAMLFILYIISRAVVTKLVLIFASSILVIYVCYEFLSDIPIVNKVLEILGRYSGNIFFIHTIIYFYLYTEFIYSFQYDFLIVIVLLLISFLFSFIVEELKKITKYNIGINYLLDKVIAYIKKIPSITRER